MKVNYWETRDIVIMMICYIGWTLLNVILIAKVLPTIAALYVAYFAIKFLADKYLRCTKCIYYARKCHICGGLVAPKLFRPRTMEVHNDENILFIIMYGIYFLIPFAVYVYYRQYSFAVISFVLLIIVIAVWRFIGCRKCKNNICPFNDEYIG